MPKIPSYTAATSWASGDLLYLVRDPAGTPVSRKITVDNILQNLVCAANSSLLKSTSGYSLTGSNAQSMIDLAGTWNTTGNPVALKIAMSNTASGATSKFLSCLAGASGTTEVLSVLANGRISSSADVIASSGFATRSSGGALKLGVSEDVILAWDAANTPALRNGANAQAFNIYNTYTSGSVYERGFMRWVSNVLEIGTEHVGASARGITLKIGSTAAITIATSGSTTFSALPIFSSGIRIGNSNGDLTLSGSVLYLSAATLLGMGGITSSFPALKRSSTILQSRLADDSDFAPLQGQLRSHANATSETPTATHTLRLYDASGTEYRVLAIAV